MTGALQHNKSAILTPMDDLSYKVRFCRKEDPSPGCMTGPGESDCFTALFVERGGGILKIGGRPYPLTGGLCFIGFPGDQLIYQADEVNPWSIALIGFRGPGLADVFNSWGLSPDSPVFSFDDTCRAFYYMDEILENRNGSPGALWRVTGNLFKVIGEIERFTQGSRHKEMLKPVEKAIRFMDRNYTRPVAVTDIAAHVCLERSYFSRIFKEQTGETPRDYLHRCRMDKAMELLLSTTYSVELVAGSVGYEDPLHFSRNFKVYSGYSPRSYRLKGRQNSDKGTNIHK